MAQSADGDGQLDQQDVRALKQMAEWWREQDESGQDDARVGQATRRKFMGLLAGAGLGAASLGGYATGQATAGTESVGVIGTQANPADAYVEDLYDHNGNQPMSFPGDGVVSVGSLEADTLNNADLANAASGTVPQAQGDGTLAMASVEFSEKVVQGVVYAGHPDFSGIQDAIDFCESNGYHTAVVPAGEEASNITISTAGICLVGLGGPAAGTNDGRVEINGINVSQGTVIKNIRHSGNWSIGADRCRLDTISGYNSTLTIDSNDNIISGYMDESLSEIVLNGDENTVTASGNPTVTDNGSRNQVLG